MHNWAGRPPISRGLRTQRLEDEVLRRGAALADTDAAVRAAEAKLDEHSRMLALHSDSLVALARL